MNPLRTRQLPRDQIANFIPQQRGQRAFEALQQDTSDQYDALTTAEFLSLNSSPSLGQERVFTPASGDLIATDGGAGADYTLALATTTVVAGAYGGDAKTISVTVDAKGRLLGVTEYALNSDNVAEGVTHLFYTDARARAALSAGTGISYNNTTGLIALDTSSSLNVDHSAVSIVAGSGLTGGGDLTATRTLSLANSGVTAGTLTTIHSITVDAYGRVTAIS